MAVYLLDGADARTRLAIDRDTHELRISHRQADDTWDVVVGTTLSAVDRIALAEDGQTVLASDRPHVRRASRDLLVLDMELRVQIGGAVYAVPLLHRPMPAAMEYQYARRKAVAAYHAVHGAWVGARETEAEPMVDPPHDGR